MGAGDPSEKSLLTSWDSWDLALRSKQAGLWSHPVWPVPRPEAHQASEQRLQHTHSLDSLTVALKICQKLQGAPRQFFGKQADSSEGNQSLNYAGDRSLSKEMV